MTFFNHELMHHMIIVNFLNKCFDHLVFDCCQLVRHVTLSANRLLQYSLACWGNGSKDCEAGPQYWIECVTMDLTYDEAETVREVKEV